MQTNRSLPKQHVDILVVEDSATQAEFLAQLLAADGYRVRIAGNGREGLRAARESAPTMIVSDIAMPEMDGFELCRQVKKDPALRQVPVILLTSLTSLYDVIKGLDCGADNFIRKPFDSTYLLGRIRFILANRALRHNERVQLGMQVSLGGQTHFITAERQQIFDLLISTYEEAIQMTEQLKAQQERIAHSYQSLEGLYKIAEALNPALTEQAVGELALERLLDFPGVLGACIKLCDPDGRLRLIATRDFAVDTDTGAACAACHCERQLQRGQLVLPQLVPSCEQVARPHACIPLATGTGTRGVLCLMTSGGALTDEEWHVLETVGNQIAVAIERARLFGHMEAQVKERTEAWQSERKLLEAVINTSGALVCMVDAAGYIRLFNPACEQAIGWPAAEAIGRPCWEVLQMSGGGGGLEQFFSNGLQRTMPLQLRGDWLARDGRKRSIIWSTASLRTPDGAIEYFVGTGVDVTELRGAEEKVHYLSNFDSVTGLPNRVLLRERVRPLLDKVLANGQLMGLMLLRPERLRLILPSLGIEAGQVMLLQLAERLAPWGRGEAVVARVGDFTFAIVAARHAAADFATLARQVLAAMNAPFTFQQQELHLDPSIGIALFPNDGDDYDSIVQGAEAALQRASSSKAARYAFYRPELNQGALERFKFEGALRRALERDELLLHYQPQVSLTTGAVIGIEALVRWQSPEFGLVAPGRFIGLAEETGLILPIGEWVLRRACEQSCAWQRAGLPAVPVSVNLSARQFSGHIVATVARILAETGLQPRLLELELTESASMEDPKKTFEILRQLKDMGVQLAIDDFGTGYSNLSYLKRFPVDKLKLDQSFVRDIISDPDDLSIARAVIAMAHGLHLTVIAEGVETASQLALLAENGCDEMQGYFFSRPVDAIACGRLLREGKSLALDCLLRQPYQRTLLYVDNEVNLLAAIKRSMRHKDYQVLVAATAAEAFEILATVEVGVILCDQRMPGMSGTELLSRVKQMYPNLTRMVLSGYTDLQSVTDAVNHGAIFKFLSKPWDDAELAGAVRDGFAAYESKRAAPRAAGRA
jgi:diguanylate cyclase (GGDEF)-like protein/PAS domain S-box-containing protein